MEINIDKEWLTTLHQILISIYKETGDPIASALHLVHDYDESLISVCVERHRTKIFGKTLYPHILQRAFVLMHSIISFHPFVDGNKRTALLSTGFYLHWNGYNLTIPNDADDFTIAVAKDERNLNDILRWLERNTTRTPFTIFRHWLCVITMTGMDEVTAPIKLVALPRWLLFPVHALLFFRTKIIDAQQRKAKETSHDK